MWSERMRRDWQHTAYIASYLHNQNISKRSQAVKPDQLNPMEAGGKRSTGIKLNSPEGFRALSQVSKQWPGRR